jgi:tetratricopeptide (TPR) repeat protein
MKRIVLDALILFALPLFVARQVQLFQAERSFQQAERLSQEKKEDQAFARYQRAAEIAPDHAAYQRGLGRSGLKLYQRQPRDLFPLFQAKRAFERLFQLDLVYPYDRFEMGEVLEALRGSGVPDQPDPEPYLQRAVATDPTNPLFLAGLMTWQLRHGQREQARRLFVRAAIAGPGAIQFFGPALLPAHEDRIKFAEELGRHPAANLAYTQYLIEAKEPELAKPQAELAAALIQEQPDIALKLAQIMTALKETEQADQVLAQAFAIAPQYLFLAQTRAELLVRQKDLTGAIAVCEKALRANPRAAGLHQDLAQIYLQAGQDDLALKHFDLALETNQADAQRRKYILVKEGEIKLKQGDLQGALVEYRKALEITPGDPQLDQKIKRIQVQLELEGPRRPTP